MCEARWNWMASHLGDAENGRLLGKRLDEFCEWADCTPKELADLLCECVPCNEACVEPEPCTCTAPPPAPANTSSASSGDGEETT